MNAKRGSPFILAAALLLAGCPGGGSVDPANMGNGLRAWFVKNTLGYDIEVQATFLALDAPGAGQWYEKAPVAWSARIRLAPNETGQVMDYVDCATISIWRASDGTLLNDSFGDRHLGKIDLSTEVPGAALDYDASLPDGDGATAIRDARYAVEAVPWDRYPIACDYGKPIPALEVRKRAVAIDGSARVMVVKLNPDAPCFR